MDAFTLYAAERYDYLRDMMSDVAQFCAYFVFAAFMANDFTSLLLNGIRGEYVGMNAVYAARFLVTVGFWFILSWAWLSLPRHGTLSDWKPAPSNGFKGRDKRLLELLRGTFAYAFMFTWALWFAARFVPYGETFSLNINSANYPFGDGRRTMSRVRARPAPG